MHIDLLGYLLGALSADEQRSVEEALAADPKLRAELEKIRRSLEPLEELSDAQDPPPGLADRTMRAVERQEEARRATPRSVVARSSALTDHAARLTPAPRHFYSISDGIVLALVGLTAITMLLPALANSRYESRKVSCQNNLRQVGSLLIEDSIRHGQRFLEVPDSGQLAFDGVFAPMLVERQLLPADTTALHCPGVTWCGETVPQRVPTLREIDQATGAEAEQLRRAAGGSYSYVVGYLDSQNRYRQIRNASRPYFPILADAPSLHLENRQSANHGGRGQNMMYEDGHITFVTHLVQFGRDDPFRNQQGHAEAGMDRNDAVLLRSEWPPIQPDRP